jgi:hypothetical protein
MQCSFDNQNWHAIGGVVKTIRIAAAACALLYLSGCASSIAYRADYVAERTVVANERISGRVLVYTTKDDDERLVTGGASSFTGAGAKLTTPIGTMTREIALKVFSQVATEGASAANDLTDAARYSIVIRPETEDFKYGFPQAKNLGLWITPRVEMQLRVSVLDASGRPLIEKHYSSGVIEGKGYVMSGSPYEKINKLAHQTLYDLMRRAAEDVRIYRTTTPKTESVN